MQMFHVSVSPSTPLCFVSSPQICPCINFDENLDFFILLLCKNNGPTFSFDTTTTSTNLSGPYQILGGRDANADGSTDRREI